METGRSKSGKFDGKLSKRINNVADNLTCFLIKFVVKLNLYVIRQTIHRVIRFTGNLRKLTKNTPNLRYPLKIKAAKSIIKI